jgi:hypothetical protein
VLLVAESWFDFSGYVEIVHDCLIISSNLGVLSVCVNWQPDLQGLWVVCFKEGQVCLIPLFCRLIIVF